MKKTSCFAGLFLILLFVSPSVTGLLIPSYTLKGTLTEETKAFFIGKTKIQGSFTGIPMDHLIDSAFVQNMSGFPLIGSQSIDHLETVIVAENIDITSTRTLDDLLLQQIDHLTYYTNVDIITEDGLFLLGINQGTMSVSADLSYAISTCIPLELVPKTQTRFFCTATHHPILMEYVGDYGVLTSISEPSTIQIKGRNGRTLWTGGSPKDYLIIQDPRFSVTVNSSLTLLPLSDTPSMEPLTVAVSQADSRDITIHQLIENVTGLVARAHDDVSLEFLQTLHDLDDFVQTTSYVTNGAIVFQQINDTVTIDHSTQRFSSAGFVRFSTLEISKVGSTYGPTIQADSVLCYLGNHFYNPSAKRSSDGISFPYELIIIWILALCAFVYIRFFARPPVDLMLDTKVKRYALIIHIVGSAVAFLLLDLEVYLLFGISGITALFSSGLSSMTGMFLFLEAILWMAGFIILGIPLQLLSYSILRFLGIGKGGNGIWKAVGDLSIWVFSSFYLLIFLNVFLASTGYQQFFSMG